MKPTRQIITRIHKVISQKDKNGNEYLILEVDSDSDIFVFPWKLDKNFWIELVPNKVLGLTLEMGRHGINNLTAINLQPFKKSNVA